MPEPKTIHTLPDQCLLLIRLEGDEHVQEVGRFLHAPWRYGINLGADFRLDPSGVMGVAPEVNGVMGVLPGGKVVYWPPTEFELMMAQTEGVA